MPQATLNWTPYRTTATAQTDGIVSQRVDYKKVSTSGDNWSRLSTVLTPTQATATIGGLVENTPYVFRVATVCLVTESYSPEIIKTYPSCPTLSITPTSTSLDISFLAAPGEVTGYTLSLSNSTGVTELSSVAKPSVINGVVQSSFVHSFPGLSPDSVYTLGLKMQIAGTLYPCTTRTARTLTSQTASLCIAPSNIIATLQSDTF